ncbi:YceD family protein [Bosea sp. (in: a-proteobacteria)]|uniref:YceD family protein n=1 Tax=Bosea sp. (in: a-proteobacteria) TaxID=1871050 RepID=UPI002FC82044
MSSASKEALPLRHPVRVETITLRPMAFELSAAQPELGEIARHLGVASVEALKGEYSLSRNGDRVKLEGKITAALHQVCVVTLEAFPVALAVPLKLDFAPEAELAAAAAADAGEIDIEVLLNEQDPPEAIVDGVIDLGAITLEFLALALDPYPRKPGASFEDSAPEAAAESPFAALARLKDRE